MQVYIVGVSGGQTLTKSIHISIFKEDTMKQIKVNLGNLTVNFVQPVLSNNVSESEIADTLLNYTGRRNSENLASEILELNNSNGDAYIEVGDAKYCITILDKKPVFKEITSAPIEQLLSKNSLTTEIKNIMADLYENASRDTTELNVGRVKVEKAMHYLIRNGRILLNKRLVDAFGRNKTDDINKELNALIRESNVIIAKYNSKKYLLEISNNIPVWKELKDYNVIVEDEKIRKFLLSKGISKEEYLYLIEEKPEWIPTGFSHVQGNLNTGYVVRDGDGNEFVYLPEKNCYVSRFEISRISPERYASRDNAESYLINRYDEPFYKAAGVAEYFNRLNNNNNSSNYIAKPLENFLMITNAINSRVEEGLVFGKDNPYNISLKNSHLIFTMDEEPIKDPHDDAYGSQKMSYFQVRVFFDNRAKYTRDESGDTCAIRIQLVNDNAMQKKERTKKRKID